MSVVLILLLASLSIAAGFLAAFIWSVKNGQYDDDYTPSIRILFEDKKTNGKNRTNHSKPTNEAGTEGADPA
jgi:cbb3-type cytochrome oxidase maturation protein